MANGLRVMFDFTLKDRLLYDVERQYFERISDNYKHKASQPIDTSNVKYVERDRKLIREYVIQ